MAGNALPMVEKHPQTNTRHFNAACYRQVCDTSVVNHSWQNLVCIWVSTAQFLQRFCIFEKFYCKMFGEGMQPAPGLRREWVKASSPCISFSFLEPFAHNLTVDKCLNNYYCQVHKQSPHTAVHCSTDGNVCRIRLFFEPGARRLRGGCVLIKDVWARLEQSLEKIWLFRDFPWSRLCLPGHRLTLSEPKASLQRAQ